MSIKRVVARVKIARRRMAEEKAKREVRELALARNKALKEAEIATKVAKGREELRLAKLKKYRAETPGRKEAEERNKRVKATAGHTIKRTIKVLRSIYKPIKKWAG